MIVRVLVLFSFSLCALNIYAQTLPSNMPTKELKGLECQADSASCCEKWLEIIRTYVEKEEMLHRPPVTIQRLNAWRSEKLGACKQKKEIELRAQRLDKPVIGKTS